MKNLKYEVEIEIANEASPTVIDMLISSFEHDIKETKINNSHAFLEVKSLTLIEDNKKIVRIEHEQKSRMFQERNAPDPNPNYLLRVKQRLRNKNG